MNIIIDTNIFISALLRESYTRKLLLEYDGEFLMPSFVYEEIDNHKKELQ